MIVPSLSLNVNISSINIVSNDGVFDGRISVLVINKVHLENLINKLENVSFKSNIISQVIYLFKTYDNDFYTNLDSTPNLVGFKNGVYDFGKKHFRDGTQNDYLTFSTGYDYTDYDETCPHTQDIYTFLGQIIPNRRVLEYTLKVLGKSLFKFFLKISFNLL